MVVNFNNDRQLWRHDDRNQITAGGISFSFTLQTSHEMALLHEHNIQLWLLKVDLPL